MKGAITDRLHEAHRMYRRRYRSEAVSTSKTMRAMLAQQGIYLDDPRAPARQTAAESRDPVEPVDRDLVREILIDRGAPASDLEWLTASCQSIDDAFEYKPPQREAWCVRCDGPQPTDGHGCLTCRGEP